MTESLNYALVFSAVGIVIVFIVLTLISLMVFVMRQVDDRWQAREAESDAQALTREPTIDGLTLVLVTAAAATMITGRFRITSVTRLSPTGKRGSAWSSSGRAVLHGSHTIRHT